MTAPTSSLATASFTAELHVVHVVLSLDCGGLEHLVLDLAQEGRELGQRVTILCLERPGTLADRASELGFAPNCIYKPAGRQWRVNRALRATLAQLQADVIHTHQMGALFYVGPALRGLARPAIIHTEHGKHYANRRRRRWLARIATRHADRFCCVSKELREHVLHHRVVARRKVDVVYNGIDTRRFSVAHDAAALKAELGIPAHRKVVGAIGRLSEVKQPDLLVRAFGKLCQAGIDAHLVMVGDGPMRAALEAEVTRLNLTERVHFAGYQPAPERYLSLFDVFALTSRSEGMPLAVLEAWAARVPVVAAKVGGVPELIQHQQNGLMFSSGDEPALVAALGQVLQDPLLGEKFRLAGWQRVETEFDRGEMARRYLKTYQDALEKRVSGAVRRST